MLPYLNIFGKQIPMYGLMIVSGILLSALLMVADCRRRRLLWEDAVIIGTTGLGCGMVGAKLLYIFVTFTPAELLKIVIDGKTGLLLRGGFVFYGGLIAGVLGAVLGARLAKEKLSRFENVLIKAIPLSHAFGRVGCFFAGCCYGKPTESAFSVVYQNPISDAPRGVPLMPVQLYEAAFDLVLFAVFWAIDKKYPKNHMLLPLYLILYSIERFLMEFLRYDAVRGGIFGLSTSQWISLLLFSLGAWIIIYRKQRKHHV